MTRKEKIVISKAIIGEIYNHYIAELKTIKSDNLISKWIFVKNDKNFNKVINEMATKKIVDIKKIKEGTLVSLTSFLNCKPVFGDYFLFNDKMRNVMDHKSVIHKSFSMKLQEDVDKKIKAYATI